MKKLLRGQQTLSIVRAIGSKNPQSSQLFGEGFAMKLWPICRRRKMDGENTMV